MSPPRAKLEEHSRRVRRMIHAARERAEFEDAEARVLDLARTAKRTMEGGPPGECGHAARKCMCHLIRTRVSYAEETLHAIADRISKGEASREASREATHETVRAPTVRLRASETSGDRAAEDSEKDEDVDEDIDAGSVV